MGLRVGGGGGDLGDTAGADVRFGAVGAAGAAVGTAGADDESVDMINPLPCHDCNHFSFPSETCLNVGCNSFFGILKCWSNELDLGSIMAHRFLYALEDKLSASCDLTEEVENRIGFVNPSLNFGYLFDHRGGFHNWISNAKKKIRSVRCARSGCSEG